MAVQAVNGHTDFKALSVPYIDDSFDVHNLEQSVKGLVYRIRPEWRNCPQELKLTKFTEGITNIVRYTGLPWTRAPLTWRSCCEYPDTDQTHRRAKLTKTLYS